MGTMFSSDVRVAGEDDSNDPLGGGPNGEIITPFVCCDCSESRSQARWKRGDHSEMEGLVITPREPYDTPSPLHWA